MKTYQPRTIVAIFTPPEGKSIVMHGSVDGFMSIESDELPDFPRGTLDFSLPPAAPTIHLKEPPDSVPFSPWCPHCNGRHDIGDMFEGAVARCRECLAQLELSCDEQRGWLTVVKRPPVPPLTAHRSPAHAQAVGEEGTSLMEPTKPQFDYAELAEKLYTNERRIQALEERRLGGERAVTFVTPSMSHRAIAARGDRVLIVNIEKRWCHSTLVGQRWDGVEICCSIPELPIIVASSWFEQLLLRRIDMRNALPIVFCTEVI